MRRPTFLLALAVLLLVSVLPAQAGIPWIKDDIDAAERESKVRKRPLLIYFHTTWCSWCAQMEDKVFSDEEVTFQANAFVPLRLNCDRREGQRLMRRYHVSAFPTVLAVTTSGDVLGRIGMYRSTPDFLRFLQESQTPGQTLAAIDKRIDGGDHSVDLLLKSAERHYEAGEFELATHRYDEAIAAAQVGQDEANAGARIGLAQIKSLQNDSAAALEQYKAVLRNYPNSKRLAEAFVGALVILREEDKGSEIDALFQEFASRFPDDPAVLNDYAKRLLETGKDAPAALQKAQRAVSLAPDSADNYGTLAHALLMNQKPSEAFEAATKAIDLRPTDKDLRILRLEIMETLRKPATDPVPATAPMSSPTPVRAPDSAPASAPSTTSSKP